MSFPDTIREVYRGYLTYLSDGGQAVHLPHYTRVHHPGLVHASDLFDCPLKAALGRSNARPKLPDLAVENSPTLLHRMMQGERMAEMFQEAFEWASDRGGAFARPEYSVADHELQLQGRIDLALTDHIENDYDKINTVVEFKHRLPTWKNKEPQPRLGDVFQLLAYMLMTKADEGYLTLIDTPAYKDFHDETKGYFIWQLRPQADYWNLVDEEGNYWAHEYNMAGLINQEELTDEVALHLSYMDGKEDPPFGLDHPDKAWQCRSVIRKGLMKAQCEHFCHVERPDYEMEYIMLPTGEWQVTGAGEW